MMSMLTKLASLKLTFAGLTWLVFHSVAVSQWPELTIPWLVLPLGLLSLNLLAAILSNRVFRSQAALLMFHIGLLCVLLLAGAGILLRFEGSVEVVEGGDFEPDQVTTRQRGWLHSSQLNKISFTQGPIEVRYRAGLLRDTTQTSVERHDGGLLVVGDRQGMRSNGYRFTTTFNKGFSVLLLWEGNDGSRSLGAVNFPSYPDLEWKQVNDWTTPAGEPLQLELKLADRVPEHQPWVLSSRDTPYRLAISSGADEIVNVGEGDVFNVDGGKVHVRDLRLWMGYRVDCNPVLPWLVVAAFLSLAALAVHVQQKFTGPVTSREGAVVGRRQEA
jgi:cytochrome c biogenesis protein